MDALSFKNALRNAKPAAEAFATIGLSKDEVIDISSSFEMFDRTMAQSNNLPDPTLRDLFARYDASNTEIGMVRFRDLPEPAQKGFIIGDVEADYLTLETPSGELVVRDHADPDHLIWKCARNGASLLAALSIAGEYLGACMIIDQAGTAFQQEALKDCVKVAGGRTYGRFYEMLLGVG
ncbi:MULTISPECIES: hypothetical protein [Sphingobium]|uniref:hypothetical protein n=1 Tax=Sphingobium TaxID=165695 RepID=UPI00242A9BD9|nr:hypothetical protein [Sphingobium yanoikuyae]